MTDDNIGATDGSDLVAELEQPAAEGDEIELAVVTMRFDSADDAALLAVLSKYVVMTRMVAGCRNVDLCASVTVPGRHLVIQKWDDSAAQRAHFDSDLMIEMAQSCDGLLAAPPDIDLWDGTSAHDLA
ncbi:MAG: putative quinol monooxygenase [Ilumatobacter sp.]|jgi:quinol monooxygenase YgiN|uniref:putative quinol monooxygenase n=1 Tax=Ilumatobacter sp. TaxID=1967498 RepID=UPI00391BFAFA